MIKIIPYSEVAVEQLFETLKRKQQEGIIVDFEIHIDGEQVIPRTNKMECFFSFRALLFKESELVEIWLYKGTSRRYDKYVFGLPKVKSIDEQVREKTNELRLKMEQEWQLKLLVKDLKDTKEKCKELKEDKKELKARIEQLEEDAKKTNAMQGIFGAFQQMNFMKSETPTELNGIPIQPLLEKLTEIHRNLGDETFQYFLGTALMLGQYPQVLPEVRKLIEQSMNQPKS